MENPVVTPKCVNCMAEIHEREYLQKRFFNSYKDWFMYVSIIMLSRLLLFAFLAIAFGNEYKAVDDVDLPKYMGKWYQMYGDTFDKLFQGNGRCSTAEYELLEDGRVSVFNKQLDKNDEVDSIPGFAYYNDGDCCGYLTVELKGTQPAPYWILELGPIVDDKYDYSVVSDNFALSLFVLARNVDDFYRLYDAGVQKSLQDFGFTKSRNSPIAMNQTDCAF